MLTRRREIFRLCPTTCVLALCCGVAWGQAPGGMPGPMGSAPKEPTFRERVMATGGPRFGPTGPQVLVVDVLITGNRQATTESILGMLQTRKSRIYDPELVQADVRNLAAKGRFSNVRPSVEPVPDGVVVTFEVFERPSIEYIRFLGNRALTDRVLMKQVGIKVGDPLNQFAIEEARRRVEEFYKTTGHSKVQVEVHEGGKPSDRGVALMISEGPVERIWAVHFEGNTIASDGRLRTLIESKPGYFKYLFGGKVDESKVEKDVQVITSYYRSLGFFRARIGRELVYDDAGRWLTLRFVIDEGPRYKIRDVSVAGADRFESQELKKRMHLQPNEYFNLGKMNQDVNDLRDTYGSQGFIFADVQADPRFLEEPGWLDLVYNVEEGQRFRVGDIRVHIDGEHPHTRNSVVLARLSIKPGDIANMEEVRKSERRLQASQLFETDPSQGEPPRIVVKPPSDLGDGSSLARGTSYRGQSPQKTSTYFGN